MTPFGSTPVSPLCDKPTSWLRCLCLCYPCGQPSQRNSLVQNIGVSYVAQRTTKSPKTSCNYNVRPTGSWQRYIVYIRLPRYMLVSVASEIAVSKTLNTHFIYIFLAAASSSTFARHESPRKFHFLIYVFVFASHNGKDLSICRLYLCVKVCARQCDIIKLRFFFSFRARFRHSGV